MEKRVFNSITVIGLLENTIKFFYEKIPHTSGPTMIHDNYGMQLDEKI